MMLTSSARRRSTATSSKAVVLGALYQASNSTAPSSSSSLSAAAVGLTSSRRFVSIPSNRLRLSNRIASTTSSSSSSSLFISSRRWKTTTGGDGKGGENDPTKKLSAPSNAIRMDSKRNGGAAGADGKSATVMSLDGTIQMADAPKVDEVVKKKRLERAASMQASPHHLGLGGATIRAVWEQESVDEVFPDLASVTAHAPKFLKSPKTVSIIGAPMSWGQPLAGTDHGPVLLQQAGLVPAVKKAGWRVNANKMLEVVPPTPAQAAESERYARETGALAHNSSAVGAFLKKLSDETEAVAKRDEFVLTIGGDHSIGLGTLAGILKARPETGVIWVDAHADLNTPLTSETGNMHGMPLGILMSDDNIRTRIPGFQWLKNGPKIRPEKLVYVGSRDLDQAERRQIKQMGILCFTMHDVDRWGIGQVMEKVFKHLGPVPLHLSYDIDAVDAEYAPHTGTVVRGGFTFREANYIAESVAETNRLCSMDMVEINPSLGTPKEGSDNETVQLGLTIIASALGQCIL